MSFDIPVAYIIYNRTSMTRQSFSVISQIKPNTLFIIADGPRSNADLEKCLGARSIVKHIDWECEVYRNYSDVNLGCKARISSGLDWVFDKCKEAIILEDDCIPIKSFFYFCRELLLHYRNTSNIGIISGANYQLGKIRGNGSYYFSKYSHIWGWASWQRTWEKYDVHMNEWQNIRDSDFLYNILGNHKAVSYWKNLFDKTFSGSIDTWDYQLLFTCWLNNLLTIIPNNNLVSNIGFLSDATHTQKNSQFANLPTSNISFPLIHPQGLKSDTKADIFTFNNHYLEGQHFTTKKFITIIRRLNKRLRSSLTS
jgi:hypothetical protein